MALHVDIFLGTHVQLISMKDNIQDSSKQVKLEFNRFEIKAAAIRTLCAISQSCHCRLVDDSLEELRW